MNLNDTNWGKITKSLATYLWLMEQLHLVDVSTDITYQKKFKGFYKVRRKQAFCDVYFNILEKNKRNQNLRFEEVLLSLQSTGRIEASFTSKLLATINPLLPVLDKEVLIHLTGSLAMSASTGDPLKDCAIKYKSMVSYYREFIKAEEGKVILNSFQEKHPDAPITDLKKIDFVLWQTRKKK